MRGLNDSSCSICSLIHPSEQSAAYRNRCLCGNRNPNIEESELSNAIYNSAFAMLNSWCRLYCVATVETGRLGSFLCTTTAIIVSSIVGGSIGDEPFIDICLGVHNQIVDLLNGNN